MNTLIKFKGLVFGLMMSSVSQVCIFLYENLYFKDFLNHLIVLEGTPLTYLFLGIYWTSGTLPNTYYDLSYDFQITKFFTMLALQDFFQYLSHYIAHKIKFQYHWPHHKAYIPNILDAFKGTLLDTSLMILVPIILTTQIIKTNCITFQIFGSFYSSYLILIHAHYEHSWEKYICRIGFMTTEDHREHHKKRNINYGHIFIFWDVIFNTGHRNLQNYRKNPLHVLNRQLQYVPKNS